MTTMLLFQTGSTLSLHALKHQTQQPETGLVLLLHLLGQQSIYHSSSGKEISCVVSEWLLPHCTDWDEVFWTACKTTHHSQPPCITWPPSITLLSHQQSHSLVSCQYWRWLHICLIDRENEKSHHLQAASPTMWLRPCNILFRLFKCSVISTINANEYGQLIDIRNLSALINYNRKCHK